jgi:TonB-dependent starch-binding outer membrane protein SusC
LDDFTVEVDWFKRTTSGILMTKRIPAYVGAISDPWANVADMDNWGIEIEAGWKKDIGAFNLGLNGNFSYLQNEVVSIGEDLKFIEGEGFQGSSYSITRTEVGRPFGSFFGFKTQGIFQNQEEIESYVGPTGGMIQPNAKPGDFRWVDVDGDGDIDENDRTYLGNPLPKYSFGFTFNVEYKGFDLSLFGQGVAGNKIFQGLRRFGIPASNFQKEALGRWTGEGTSNTYPRLVENDPNNNFANPSDFYLKKGDYFRIKNLQLGYTLKPALLSKVGMDRVRVYVMAENLFTFTRYNGYDPEIGGNTMSIDRGVYPQAKSYMVGMNVGF